MLPDITKQPVDPSYAGIIDNYKKSKGTNRLAITSAGGGAKGRWEVGFMYRLQELGVLSLVDLYTGTSVGGLNSLLASRYQGDYQKVVDVWRSIEKDDDIYLGSFALTFWSVLSNSIKSVFGQKGLLDPTPLERLVQAHFGSLWACDLKVPVWTVTVSKKSGKKVIMGGNSTCIDMALSTSRIPGAFPLYKDEFFDGGLGNNVPVDIAIERGATKVIVLFCDEDPVLFPPVERPDSIINNAITMAEIIYARHEMDMWEKLDQQSRMEHSLGLVSANWARFYPSQRSGGMLDFTSHNLLQQGYDDCVKYMTPSKLTTLLLSNESD